jgi:hypothetical protein
MGAWSTYIETVRYQPAPENAEEHDKIVVSKQTKLIFEMMKCVGFKLSETDIQTSAYAAERPRGRVRVESVGESSDCDLRYAHGLALEVRVALFVVGYDLKTKKDEKRDYKPIEDALEELDSCHTQESVWYVERDGTAAQLRDHLKTVIEERDWLMVVKFTAKPSWTKAKSGTKAWLDKRFS